ncbi:unnamed protein product [Oikopleura dioica]|uniref:Dynein light chain n=1 Tax=Oikopleura dioica TaxID=34765 RepID=E4X052_OIKDI|nr:unnamed protein product [Oikopleura dioica]CBY23150.1 unnamed protein product [Oikopleura dioica]
MNKEEENERRDIDIEHAKAHQFPLVLPESDMNEEMSTEIQELVVGLLEKHPFGLAAKETFEVLNKKFGVGWNIVIGKAFHSEFQAVKGTVLMMYYQGVYGIHIWKSEK